MPKFNTSVPHTLGKEKAKTSLKGFFEKAKEFGSKDASDVQEDWSKWDTDGILAFSFKTFGIAIKGLITVLEDKVNIEGEIPFAAMMFKGKIEEGFREKIGKAIA
ncbi:MAG: hypothetical protein C0483_12550 [Pirellula sp.]|nr:hypothetical protein [Pirellula sp.]